MECPSCGHEFKRKYTITRGRERIAPLNRRLMALNFHGTISQSELLKIFPDNSKIQLKNGASAMIRFGHWTWVKNGVYKKKAKVKNGTD